MRILCCDVHCNWKNTGNWKNAVVLGLSLVLLLQVSLVYLMYFRGTLVSYSVFDQYRQVTVQNNILRTAGNVTTTRADRVSSNLTAKESRNYRTAQTLASVSGSSNIISSPPLKHSPLLTWKEGSFCHDFIERQFYEPVAVCASRLQPNHSIDCHRTPLSARMIQCTVQNIALLGPRVPREKIRYALLQGEKQCPDPFLSGVEKSTEGGDPIRGILKNLTPEESLSTKVCKKWISKTAFVYFGEQGVHIYFRFNAYFNLYKAIRNEGFAPGEYVIIRLPQNSHLQYLFPEWEKRLFPELYTLDHDLPNTTVCFKRVIFVSRSFSGVLFRCKMESNILNKCYNCKGRGLYGTSLYSFRNRVLSSCGLIDSKKRVGKKVIFISRKPYKRWKSDEPEKFERVLTNEGELMKSLRKTFPDTNVTVAHMEGLDICTQIRLVHEADVLMGVHGAGLVHLWWLQEDAMLLELNPTYEETNPTFKMLSTLTGTNYRSLIVQTGVKRSVSVNVGDVLNILRTYSHLT